MAPSDIAPVLFQLDPNKPKVEFRFTIPSMQALEEEGGCSAGMLHFRGSVRALVLMLMYALKHQDDTITKMKAQRLIQRFLDNGGNVKELSDALVLAINNSRVYGDAPAGDEDEDEADPTTPTKEVRD